MVRPCNAVATTAFQTRKVWKSKHLMYIKYEYIASVNASSEAS